MSLQLQETIAIEPAAPKARLAKGIFAVIRKCAAFCWKYVFGAWLTFHPLTSLLIVGWANRLAQRAALRAWWKRSPHRRQGLSFADFVASLPALAGHACWPRWIMAADAKVRLRVLRQPGVGIGQRARGWLGVVFGSLWQNTRLGVQTAFNVWVFTAPACFLWLVSWYFGWNNSFYKVYEEHFLGFTTGFCGIALFIAAMLYVPLAQARQAVTGDWRAFYHFAYVWRLAWQRPFACLGLAALYALLSVPIAVLKTAPYFIPEERYAALTDAQLVQFLNAYFFWTGFVMFPAYVVLRLAAAPVYASAVLRDLRTSSALPRFSPLEREVLTRLDLADKPAPAERYLIVKALGWTASRAGRLTVGLLLLLTWFTFVAQIYVGEFLNSHGALGWINQPLIHLPWLRFIPGHLTV